MIFHVQRKSFLLNFIVAALSLIPNIRFAEATGFAPSSRIVKPQSVLRTTGSVVQQDSQGAFAYTLSGPNASITYDFGQETAGIPTIKFGQASCGIFGCSVFGLPGLICLPPCQALGLSYSESAQFVGPTSDQSTVFSAQDGTVYLPLSSHQEYTVPAMWGRGGFRYLTLSLGSGTSPSTSVSVELDHIYYTAAPNLDASSLNAYTGEFSSSDKLLNDIWYAGAYALQLSTVAANTSVQHLYAVTGGGWSQDATATGLTGQYVFLADGAKRDRNPWAGDASIVLRTAMVAQNYDNLVALRNLIQEVLILQDKSFLSGSKGYFPYAGSPLGDLLILAPLFIAPFGSDTYHLWLINVFAEYVLLTNDVAFLTKFGDQILTGIQATYAFVQDDGLFNGTRTLDWGRIGQGGKNSALNALYYDTLNKLTKVARSFPSQTLGYDPEAWSARAQKLKIAYNQQLWDSSTGLYRDNTTSAGAKVYPQDGNSFAIEYNLTQSDAQASTIARKLASRLTKFGSPSPELPGSVSPFIGSHELIAQFKVAESTGEPAQALSLARKQWGYMRSAFSNTTFIEGYGADGTLKYGFYEGAPSFISHAHAWATGPVYSLMHDVVGIAATALDVADGDGDWSIKPTGALGDLSWASGSVQLPRGKFANSWKRSSSGAFDMTISSPSGRKGTVYVPLFGQRMQDVMVMLNGVEAISGTRKGPFLRIPNVAGDNVVVSLKPRKG